MERSNNNKISQIESMHLTQRNQWRSIDLIRLAKSRGCEIRSGGKHSIHIVHVDQLTGSERLLQAVPMHKGKNLATGTARAIVKKLLSL